MHHRRLAPWRRGSPGVRGTRGRALCRAVILCLAVLLCLTPDVAAPGAKAETLGESTVGTASTVSPSTLAAGGTLTFTLSGFPRGATVQIVVDDGALVSARDAAAGRDVVAEIVVGPDGTASGAIEMPEYVGKGIHWLRFRVSRAPEDTTLTVPAAEYTNKSPYFTVSEITVIGGEVSLPPEPTPSATEPPQTASPSPQPTGQPPVAGAGQPTADAQASAVEVTSGSYSFLGTGILGLAILVCVLAAVIVFNRWRLARHRRRVFRSA